MRYIKTFLTITICIFMIIYSAPVVPRAEGLDTTARLSLKSAVCDDGTAEISLVIDSPRGICGLLATLEFDGAALALMSCGVEEQNANALSLSYIVEQNRVVFLLDGNKNSTPEGVLVKFYFKLTDASVGGDVRVLPIADRCAFFIDRENNLKELAVDTSAASIIVSETAPELILPPVLPRVCSVSVRRGCCELLLDITGGASGEKHFAAGFKIFAVDTETAQTTTVIIAKITNGSTFELSVAVPIGNRTCIIITPLCYNGKTITEGEKQIYLFE